MYKLWGKIIKNNKIIKSIVIENDDIHLSDIEKREYCLEQICYEFDLQKPSWFNNNENDFKKYTKTSFTQDNFIETINFDKLEIEFIDENKI